ncbi:F-type H+-transporting ATPase subunit b [Andreprevotia lacus DSM 23236]|jgi:F-type H+-transporting ATPase subunit b|uniref:ATP synthase subunit b n=1 Tax=Andreprevotia lacus DSM 23236 TaxID=1121001 RepID=A0A1W1XBC3_9NEIS|nr:F0F1 ATP synthase subunit B [Andreprevotia lacus]SMC21236.1 F-type H+-transporting ATPase subunit b [Andreprevotia lacus DSM 23236]
MEFNSSLIGQMITFVALVLFTMKFVWPPLTGMMEERARRIADGLSAADRAKQDLANAEKASADKLREAKQHAAEIIAQAEKRASQLVEEAKSTAKEEGERLVKGAQAEIDSQVQHAKEALRQQVGQLAVDGATKILKREIDAAKHADLLASIKAEL